MKNIFLLLLILLGLKSQAQVFYCDSISYGTSSTLNYPLVLSGSALNVPGTVTWNWTVCNANLCYSSSGLNANFGQVLTTDTLKVCYDVLIEDSGVTYLCSGCDTLVYNFNSYQWELLPRTPTAINEIRDNTKDSNKIYDILGRELKYVPVGKMYIRNNRLYMGK